MAKKTAEKQFKDIARIYKTSGHPARLAILETLLEGAKTVGDIQATLALSQPNLSQHLAILKRVGLINSQASGAMRCYYMIRPAMAEDLLALAHKEYKPVEPPKDQILAQAVDTTSGSPRRAAAKKTAPKKAVAEKAAPKKAAPKKAAPKKAAPKKPVGRPKGTRRKTK